MCCNETTATARSATLPASPECTKQIGSVCLLADLDNDGLKDLHIANGYRKEVTDRDYLDFLLPEVAKTLQSKDKNLMPFKEKLAAYKVRNFVFQNKGNWQFEDKSGDWMTIPGSWSGGGAWAI